MYLFNKTISPGFILTIHKQYYNCFKEAIDQVEGVTIRKELKSAPDYKKLNIKCQSMHQLFKLGEEFGKYKQQHFSIL